MTDFNFTNAKDRLLYQKVLKEEISIFGIDVEYWRVIRDSTKDDLYNEDTKPLISAKYSMKMYGKILEETYMLSRFGIESIDEMEVTIDRDMFEDTLGDDEVPYEGDYVYISYMDRIFQISDVKDSDEHVFLQDKFAYKLMLRPADIAGEEVTENIGIDDYEASLPDIDDSDLIDTLDDDVVVTKTDDTSPFGSWE